jgi:small-conductance mechanosensitive channel
MREPAILRSLRELGVQCRCFPQRQFPVHLSLLTSGWLRATRPHSNGPAVAVWLFVGLWMVIAGGAAGISAAAPDSADKGPSATQSAPPAQAPVLPLTADQIAGHVGQTVDWYHHLEAVRQLQIANDDSALAERLHQQSLTAVELAFDFGEACVALLKAESRRGNANSNASPNPNANPNPKANANPNTSRPNPNTNSNQNKKSQNQNQNQNKNSNANQNPNPNPNSNPNDDAAPAGGFASRLDQAAAALEQRVNTLQAQLAALDEQIPRARGKDRATLVAQRGQVAAALSLAREVQSSVADMEKFEASTIAGDNGSLSPLAGQIANMERSVPEAHRVPPVRGSTAGGSASRPSAEASGNGSTGGGAAGGAGAGAAAAAGTGSGSALAGLTPAAANSGNSSKLRPESAGAIALATDWFSLSGMRRQLTGSIKETADLLTELEKIRSALTAEVRKVVGSGIAMSTSTAAAELLAQRQALAAATARFKQLSTVLVPLGEQGLTVESAAATLNDWRESLEARMRSIVRYLALRIGLLLGWIAVVLIVSEIWRRATFRYLHDLRRRRQFLVLRRVAVAIALTLVIVFGLVSELGSVATYIGFVTAGVAVALQNVILAVVAYFFLIGRYGVRVGDRITLAGVTGRVVDIGLVRIYLMELSGTDLHSTGRMVVLSNAVLFQPTALFKQIPGADYVWHTVTLTIAATADVVEAHKRLQAAANAVYDKYRPAIERQHAMVQRFIDFDASSPQPEVRMRLTENGLECSVRYPVELENAAVIDQQMLKALRDALEHDSQFKLVASGAVVLKSSDN